MSSENECQHSEAVKHQAISQPQQLSLEPLYNQSNMNESNWVFIFILGKFCVQKVLQIKHYVPPYCKCYLFFVTQSQILGKNHYKLACLFVLVCCCLSPSAANRTSIEWKLLVKENVTKIGKLKKNFFQSFKTKTKTFLAWAFGEPAYCA